MDAVGFKFIIILAIGGVAFLLVLLIISLCICRCIWGIQIPHYLTNRSVTIEPDNPFDTEKSSTYPTMPDATTQLEIIKENEL